MFYRLTDRRVRSAHIVQRLEQAQDSTWFTEWRSLRDSIHGNGRGV